MTTTHLRRRGRTAHLRAPLQGRWKLDTGRLMMAIAACPSRQQLERGAKPRADLAENLGKLYEAIWRWAITTHNAHVYTTWAQLAAALYDDPMYKETPLRRWLALMAEAGLLTFGEDKDEFGRSLRLKITLLEPPAWLLSGPAPVAQLDGSTLHCEARRRHETRSQRRARRIKPGHRQAGRGTAGATPRFDFFWGLSVEPVGPGRPTGLRPGGDQAEGQGQLQNSILSDAIEAGSQRDAAPWPRSDGQVANDRHREGGIEAVPRSETCLATRSEPLEERRAAVERRWKAWASRIGPRLAELAEKRSPSYDDIAEAFALAVGGAPDAPTWGEEGGPRHCRLKTRQALEREAARYDRYADRLAADGCELRHQAAMALLIEAYANGGCVSPGGPLTKLGKAARALKRDWHARHPDVKERRRRERIIRRALERVDTPKPWARPRVEPRRPAAYDDPDSAERWRIWSNWQQGETWLRTLTEHPEWGERPEWG